MNSTSDKFFPGYDGDRERERERETGRERERERERFAVADLRSGR